jgi:hypothetical protein
MPRSTKSPHVAVLDYFRTADLAVAVMVLDLAKDAVRSRQTPASASARPPAVKPSAQEAVDAVSGTGDGKPVGRKRGPKSGSKRKAKVATFANTDAPAKPRGKPGPKPGSKRKKQQATEPPLDLREPVGEYEPDLGFEQAEHGEYAEPEGELQSQN